jgi:hypothetical protein
MTFSWNEPINQKEERMVKEFIVYMYDAFIKWGDDRNIDHALYFMVREITKAIGALKNLKMSLDAKIIIGKCYCWKDVEKKVKVFSKKITLDHDPPAKMFYDEFRIKKLENKPFTYADADHWLNTAHYVAITKEEDKLLRSRGWWKERPTDAYDQLGIETVEVWKNK